MLTQELKVQLDNILTNVKMGIKVEDNTKKIKEELNDYDANMQLQQILEEQERYN